MIEILQVCGSLLINITFVALIAIRDAHHQSQEHDNSAATQNHRLQFAGTASQHPHIINCKHSRPHNKDSALRPPGSRLDVWMTDWTCVGAYSLPPFTEWWGGERSVSSESKITRAAVLVILSLAVLHDSLSPAVCATPSHRMVQPPTCRAPIQYRVDWSFFRNLLNVPILYYSCLARSAWVQRPTATGPH